MDKINYQASNLSMDDMRDPYSDNYNDYSQLPPHRMESSIANIEKQPMSFSPDRREFVKYQNVTLCLFLF